MAAVIRKMLDYAAWPLSKFKEYERPSRIHPGIIMMRNEKKHFRALVLHLLRDKDHTKVYEAVAKVEKAMGRGTS